MQIGVLLPPLVSICCLQGFVQVLGRFLAGDLQLWRLTAVRGGRIADGGSVASVVSISFAKSLCRFLAGSWQILGGYLLCVSYLSVSEII